MMLSRLSLASLALPARSVACSCMATSLRCITGGAGNPEPTASPWVKVVDRPGDDAGNRGEDNPAHNPYKDPRSGDPLPVEQVCGWSASSRVACILPDTHTPTHLPVHNARSAQTFRRPPSTPRPWEAAASNPSVDSVRHLAGKLNEAVGG